MVIKRLCFIMVCTFSFLILVSCSNKTSNYKLEIVCQPWDGSQDYSEEEQLSWRTTEIYDIVKGDVINIPSGRIKIIYIDDLYIKIETDQPMSSLEAGIDMSSTQTVFTLNIDETLNLDTLWYDAGFLYELRLID